MPISFSTRGELFQKALAGKYGSQISKQAKALAATEQAMSPARSADLDAQLGAAHNQELALYTSINRYLGKASEQQALGRAEQGERDAAVSHQAALQKNPDALTAGNKTFLLQSAGVKTTVSQGVDTTYGSSALSRAGVSAAYAAVGSAINKNQAVVQTGSAFRQAVAGKNPTAISAALGQLNLAELGAANGLPKTAASTTVATYLTNQTTAVSTPAGDMQLVDAHTGEVTHQVVLGMWSGSGGDGEDLQKEALVVSGSLKASPQVVAAHATLNLATKQQAGVAAAIAVLQKAELHVLQAPGGSELQAGLAATLSSHPDAIVDLNDSSSAVQLDPHSGKIQFTISQALSATASGPAATLDRKAAPIGAKNWNAAASQSELYAAGKGPQTSDVHQGAIGDCYFMASLAAVAQSDPAQIQKNIKQTGSNTYTVTLYKNARPVIETVTTSGLRSPAAQDPKNGKQILWPVLYEKAMAQMAEKSPEDTSGFADIGRGSSITYGLNSVKGTRLGASSITDATPEMLRSQLAQHKPTTCGAATSAAGTGIIGPHVYSVLAIDAANNVTVRNPWGFWGAGHTDPHIKVGADGTATMSFSAWQKYYVQVSLYANGA
jgi:hypothetical protein